MQTVDFNLVREHCSSFFAGLCMVFKRIKAEILSQQTKSKERSICATTDALKPKIIGALFFD